MILDQLSLLAQTSGDSSGESAGDGSSFSFPEQASTFAARTDDLYHAIFWISLAFFAVIVVLMVYFCFAYRRREGEAAEPSPSHNTWLEITWTVVPTLFLIWMFYEGAIGFMDMRNPPDVGIDREIKVVGSQWNWTFEYPNGERTDTLHLAINEPVVFKLQSEDVLHSFYIPEFRVKWDVVPGRITKTWVKPTRTSTEEDPFRLYCAEYCGESHSEMKSDVIVHDMLWDEMIEEYVTYDYVNGLPHENGEQLYKVNGCVGCHSVDGKDGIGPSFKGFWGTEVDTDKGPVLVDENYVTESILQPAAKIRAGKKPQMPALFGGRQLRDDEIGWIIAYIRHVNGETPTAPENKDGDGEDADNEKETQPDSGDKE